MGRNSQMVVLLLMERNNPEQLVFIEPEPNFELLKDKLWKQFSQESKCAWRKSTTGPFLHRIEKSMFRKLFETIKNETLSTPVGIVVDLESRKVR